MWKGSLSVGYQRKADLVERLQKHYEETFAATPDKEFFLCLRKTWQEVKSSDDKANETEHFAEIMWSWQDDVDSLNDLTAPQINKNKWRVETNL